MEDSKHMTVQMTPAQAVDFVKHARGKWLFISVGQSAPITDQPGHYFPIMGNVPVTRKVALKFLADAYSETMVKRGAMCVIHAYHDCVFIGRAA